MNPYFILFIGVVCAGIGGELFVRGLIGVAKWARVSAAIIGTTVAAFATSSPELSVAIGAAWSGKPEISLGDALGSNVVNVSLILGLALCISSIRSPRSSVRRDFPVALLVPVAVAALGFDGELSRTDGVALLIFFFSWLTVVSYALKQERSAAPEIRAGSRHGVAALQSIVGLLFLAGSGKFIVQGARGIAESFGIPEFVIGAVVVSIGTSIPELATTIISQIRKHDEIGLGTVLGSNIFNGLFIVGVATVICPIRFEVNQILLTLIFGVATTLITLPRSDGLIPRNRGLILLILYAVFVGLMMRNQHS